ncbi:MAG: DUF3412 domain-containing protein [Candidatus Peribacteraceae bacterium]|nr:DUF3412 domain-containing protein [Candidatus Peribacteraceae bacterium]
MEQFHTFRQMEVDALDQRLSYLPEEDIQYLTSVGNGHHETLRRCCLGILHAGTDSDSTTELLERYPTFNVTIARTRGSIKFILENGPLTAFIDGQRIHESMREHLCSAAIDLIFHARAIGKPQSPHEITDAVFRILDHASVFQRIPPVADPLKLVERARYELTRITCFGGHAISDTTYKYGKTVCTRLAERFCEFISGGGQGIMRSSFSGAAAAYAAERITNARMFGFNCPGIITSEPPNLFVKPLVILPDIEKRLEAFIRASMGCIIFPGGPGTAEEIQMILSMLLHEENRDQVYPVILTGPESSRDYFEAIDSFIMKTVGRDAIRTTPGPLYEIIINDPERVAQHMMAAIERAKNCRAAHDDQELWYRSLYLPEEVQQPFHPTHENVSKLEIHRNQSPYVLCAQLRRLFSAIVYGNVTDDGVKSIQKNGPYELRGDAEIMREVSILLERFVAEKRMKLEGEYDPCYKVIT